MSLATRKHKIDKVAQSQTTRVIYKPSPFKRVYHVDSVRTGKPFQVILEWSRQNGIKTVKGFLFTFDAKEAVDLKGTHPANDGRYVPYQILGAVKRMASESGKRISFCEDKKDAFLVSQFGGEIVKIVTAKGEVWAVVKDADKRSFRERVTVLRGEKEMGIE